MRVEQSYKRSTIVFFKKVSQPRPLFVYLMSFQRNNTILTRNRCEKCPSSLQRRDANPQPLEHESSPITT